jgi:hypothetical protein
VETNQEFYGWAAAQLIDEIRKGELSELPEHGVFFWYPFLDSLWQAVQPSDKSVILALMQNPHTLAWGLLLSRGLPEDAEIASALSTLFQEARGDPEQRLVLFHELAYRENSDDVKRQLLAYLVSGLDRFLQHEILYFGGKGGVLEGCRARMANSKFTHKRWVYLFTALASGDRESAEDFIRGYTDDADPLVREAARVSAQILRSE